MKLPVFLIASANWPEMPIIQLATAVFCPSYNKQTNKRGSPCRGHPFLFRYELLAEMLLSKQRWLHANVGDMRQGRFIYAMKAQNHG